MSVRLGSALVHTVYVYQRPANGEQSYRGQTRTHTQLYAPEARLEEIVGTGLDVDVSTDPQNF